MQVCTFCLVPGVDLTWAARFPPICAPSFPTDDNGGGGGKDRAVTWAVPQFEGVDR